METPVNILVIAEFDPVSASHSKTNEALAHTARALGIPVSQRWLSTEAVTPELLGEADGLWIAPGSPYKSLDGALAAIRFARTKKIPLLGTCGGFQHMIIEYARHVLGHEDAQHAEYDSCAPRLFVSRLACSLVGRAVQRTLRKGSQVADLYGSDNVTEQYYCSFGVNPIFVPDLEASSMEIVGADAEGAVRVVELPDHPFFIGTLYVPQTSSDVGQPHPLINGFVRAARACSSVDAR